MHQQAFVFQNHLSCHQFCFIQEQMSKLLEDQYTRIVMHNLNNTQTQVSDHAYTHIYSHTNSGRNGHGSDLGKVQSAKIQNLYYFWTQTQT